MAYSAREERNRCMKLDSVVDIVSMYDDSEPSVVAERTIRKYGISACEALAEAERRQEIVENLRVVMEALTENQRKVLLMTGAGYTLEEIGTEVIMAFQNVKRCRDSIPKTLEKAADEDRIQFLREKIEQLSATSRERHSKLYADLKEELAYKERIREALKKLIVLLEPPVSMREMNGSAFEGAYPFEIATAVGTGIRQAIDRGHKVMKPTSKCVIPEYLHDAFCDSNGVFHGNITYKPSYVSPICCTLCAKCKRKKDVDGRDKHGDYGIEKSLCSELHSESHSDLHSA
jgi:hypothetical protein|nr:MAG TPA: sigma factor [Caudoviricetes sp.]